MESDKYRGRRRTNLQHKYLPYERQNVHHSMFSLSTLHVDELCLIHYNALLLPIVLCLVHFNLTVFRKVRNVEVFSLAERVFPSFTFLDHRGRRDVTLWT